MRDHYKRIVMMKLVSLLDLQIIGHANIICQQKVGSSLNSACIIFDEVACMNYFNERLLKFGIALLS